MNNFKIAIDCIIIGYDIVKNDFNVLLTKRINAPHKGEWALPGGFVNRTEEFEDTAKSILKKETGVEFIDMSQLKAYSLTDKKENNRIISIVYFSIINLQTISIDNGNQLSKWFNLHGMSTLPFDHSNKVNDVMTYIMTNAYVNPYLYKLLPEKFTLNQLQKVYESLFGIAIDNRNFRKRIKKMAYLEKLEELETNVSRRPGYLYRFNESKYTNSFKMF